MANRPEEQSGERRTSDIFLQRNASQGGPKFSITTGPSGWEINKRKEFQDSNLRSARLPNSFVKSHSLKGLHAQSTDAVTDEMFEGPFSVVIETARYTMSDRIGRNYTPQARGLTIAGLNIPPASKIKRKGLKASRSATGLRGAPLETAIPSPCRAAPFAAWRPKQERSRVDYSKFTPVKPSEAKKSISGVTKTMPKEMSVPHSSIILSSGRDEYEVPGPTFDACSRYWSAVRDNIESDTGIPPLKQIWLEQVNSKIPSNVIVSDELLREWYYDYVRCVGRSYVDYELLQKNNSKFEFSNYYLLQFPEWWTDDQYKCPSWRVLRRTSVDPERVIAHARLLADVKDATTFAASLSIADLWEKYGGKSMEFTEVRSKQFLLSLPVTEADLVAAIEVQTKQQRASVRDMWMNDVYAVLEHKIVRAGAGSILQETNMPLNESKIKGPLEDGEDTQGTSSMNTHVRVKVQHPNEAIGRRALRNSIVQMKSLIRGMGDRSINSYVKLYENYQNGSTEDGKVYEFRTKEREPTRVSKTHIILSALKHANGKLNFSEAISHLNVSTPVGIFRVTCIMNNEGQLLASPTRSAVQAMNVLALNNIKTTTNSSMEDIVECVCAAVPAASLEIDNHIFAYTDESDILVAAKAKTCKLIDLHYERIEKYIDNLRRYEYIFSTELDDYVESVCNRKPTGKDGKHKVSDHGKRINAALKKLENKRACAVNAVGVLEPFDMFTLVFTGYRLQVETRFKQLSDILVKSYAKQLDQLMESICNEYSSIADRMLQVPEDSEDLKELIQFFDDVQPRVVNMKDVVEQEIFAMAAYLMQKSYIFDVRSMAHFWSAHGWREEIEAVMERSINIQNQEKIKREEILISRRLYFEKELDSLDRDAEKLKAFDSLEDDHVKTYSKRLNSLGKLLENTVAEAASINEQEMILRLESGETQYGTRLKDLGDTITIFQNFWGAVKNMNDSFVVWKGKPLWEQDAEAVENDVDTLRRTFIKYEKDFRSKDMHDAADIAAEATAVCDEFYSKYLPLMELLCTRGLKKRHWDEINKLTGLFIPYAQNANLKQMINYSLYDHVEIISDTCINASKEFSLEQAMDKMEEEWAELSFPTKAWKDTGTHILGSVEEVEQVLDDQIVRTQAMRGSRYIAPFIERCTRWENLLKTLEEILGEWLKVQGTWLYLEPIFSSEDIRKQMPMEAKRFLSVDRTWRDIMVSLQEDASCLSVAKQEGMIDKLIQANKLLDLIQKGLADYLNTKRVFFPRFFFLSNDELLEILSETKDPTRVLPHLKKCFEGVYSLEFQPDLAILAMISAEKEKVYYDYEAIGEKVINPNDSGGCVEIWLDQIQTCMRKIMALKYDQSMVDYGKREPNGDRTGWLKDWPGQIVLGVSQTYWTTYVTEALKDGPKGSKALHLRLTDHLNDIIQMVRDPSLSKTVKKTTGPLCVLDVHARDTVVELERLGIDDPNDFDWLCQFRYYWSPGGESVRTGAPGSVLCKMINAEREYAFEYLGNSMRLVVTPLTDRCYRTLMGAIHLDYGGAPAGPAGTGKTETVKDLGKNCAIQCVVYNCSDSLDYLAMGKFFKGLAGTGAWSCFDEFNRINLEVLSVIAQQILTITRAKVAKLERFDFEGENIQLRTTCNVFVTMNPGYAGRQELPDNLKALFRSVAMMVPDYAQIGQIILYSMGYLDGLALARKIVMTYKLCSEQLSNQRHYDYGMRAVVAVLRASGNLKKKLPDAPEANLVLRSIIDVNLPKFLAPDVPLFKGIVGDLFPGIILEDVDYGSMLTCVLDMCKNSLLQPTEYFLKKIFEIYEMFIVRHGFMIVGQPFAGKSNALRMLKETLTEMNVREPENKKWKKVYTTTINPKSIPMGQLYGEFDGQTHEWSDGVLAISYRNFAAEPPKVGNEEDLKWVIFDGPVDAIWIENMNTVLDDNKKLCLMSGEMISMSGTMSMIFEPMDLEVASPATVSRVGVVYLEPHRMGWFPILQSWCDLYSAKETDQSRRQWFLSEEEIKTVKDLFSWICDPAICYVKTSCNCRAPTVDQQLVVALLRLIQYQLEEVLGNANESESAGKKKKGTKEKEKKVSNAQIESIFVFSLINSIGSIIDDASHEYFNAFLRDFITDPSCVEGASYKKCNTQLLLRNWTYPYPNFQPRKLVVPLPKGSVYDYEYNHQANKWILWKDTIEKSKIPSGASFSSIVIDTKMTAMLRRMLTLLMIGGAPTLVMGPTGTGKSVFIKKVLTKILDQDVYKPIFVGFTAQTTGNDAQLIIDGKLDKRRKGVYGPSFGTKAVVFVDDVNMPEVEEYGAQAAVELLRQMCANGGWYDIQEKSWRELIDTQLICAMGPPGGSNNHITPRMMRHLNLICIDSFDSDSLIHIFSSIVDWHMHGKKLPSDAARFSKPLVCATIAMYNESQKNLLPTPAKSHYTFNVRDVARIIQGILLLTPHPEINSLTVPKLWLHECTRVISDRLVDVNDNQWFLANSSNLMQEHFQLKITDIIGNLDPSGSNASSLDALRRLFFGNYANEEKMYKEISDIDGLVHKMDAFLIDYNDVQKTKMDLVLFVFAVEHISRIARVLSMPGGNMLLVGVGGSGRQSLSRLAAFMLEYDLKQIELSKNYGSAEWRDDIKAVLRGGGSGEKPFVFLFSDTQVKDENFVQDISSILNTGEVPNIFAVDEKMEIIDAMRGHAKNLPGGGKNMTTVELWEFFLRRCRDNLHIVLAFSPIGDSFRTRLRKFPSIINCSTIDWFFAWPIDALEAVASSFLKSVKLDDAIKTSIVKECGHFHQSARKLSEKFAKSVKRITYMTPTSYLELIKAFQSSLEIRRDIVKLARDRYANGLEKLAFAASQVEIMQTELTEMIPILEDSTQKTQALMATIEEKLPGVTIMKNNVSKEAAVIQVDADACAAMKKSCEDDLAVAIPLLEDAMNALNTLKPSDITEVKAMKTPPGGVVMVMSAICDMMNVKPEKVKDPNDPTKKVQDYWGPSKKHLLGDTKFIQKLKDYDKDNIDPKIIAKIQKKYVSKDEFDPAIIKKASVAAMGLCKWVRAMEAYDRVAKVVAPKKAKLKESEETLAVTMQGLNKKKAELKKVEDELSELERALEQAVNRKDELEKNVQLCNEKLVRAKELIDGLGGEQARWSHSVAELGEEYTNVTGNVLIASGVMAYLGPFTSEFRVEIVKNWVETCKEKHIPCSNAPSLVRTLGDPVKIRQWNIDGLPTDSMSVDNAICLFNSRRWPLMIDPQGQANKWIKQFETVNGLKVIKLSDQNYMRNVENAVQFGSPVLLENVLEEMDPTLEPLLQKAIFKQSGVMCIRLGDSTVEYSDQFRFYITTKLRNPHYLPEIAVKVTLLNFMITPSGLRDQLLACVVQEERPDLAEEKNRLIALGAKNASLLKDCEDKILHILATSTGNILEDSAAIEALKQSKVISTDIKEKQAVADETEKQIDNVRSGYVPVSIRGQILYFTIASLANIEPTYQYSLEWYTKLFVLGIQKAEQSRDKEQRLNNIIVFFSYSLYANVCRSLLEKDKLLFSFLLTVRLLQESGAIDYNQWYFLVTGGVVTENSYKNPAKKWLSDKAWGEICRISELDGFSGIRQQFQVSPEEWRHIYDSAEPQKESLPGDWNALGQFQKMLVLRAIRPDKIVVAVRDFVMTELGDRYVKPPPFDLQACYDDSSILNPLVFVLSAGSDPMAGLLKFVADVGITLHTISLGQGQGPKAELLMKNSMKDGSWVILQNCHLATSWMPSLERICEQMNPKECKKTYRLWCTTYPSPDFPVSILQNAVKMTVEPPAGMRANIIGSYKNDPISDPAFFSSVEKAGEFRTLLYSLCFFHANIQERREFGALGWNNPYEFNESDLRITIKQLAMFLDLYEKLPFKALNYCTGQCNYGGRVTDDKDRRLLMTLLKDYFCPEVLLEGHSITKSGSYKMPPDGTWEAYVHFAEALPLSVDPEVFCLHENANMTKDQKSTTELFVSILLTEEAGGGGADDDDKKTPEQILFEVAENTLSKFPDAFDMELASLRFPTKWDNSMNTVLVQELERFNSLVAVIKMSLKDIMNAVKGLTVMSGAIEKAGNAVFFGKVPSQWMDASYPSLKPMASYVTDLLERLVFFQKWLDTKAPPTFWVSGFYFTQAFLTGTLQNYARRYTIEIDDVDFDFEIMPKPQHMYRSAPKDGVYIYGLFIDGARWDADAKVLVESQPKVLFANAPVIWLKPKASKEMSVYDNYDCPVYKTSERRGMLSTTGHSTNFVTMIRIPSDRPGDEWIKAGVAMLTQLDD